MIIAYGTLMTGECSHGLCRNAVDIRPCTVHGTLYDTGWGFPAFVPGETGVVHAELVEIPAADWPDMDRLEGYPVLYGRQIVSATPADGGTVDAWVYVMNDLPKQAKVIPGSDWKKRK